MRKVKIISILAICLLLLISWRICVCKGIYDSCSTLAGYVGTSLPKEFNSLKDIQGEDVDLGYCNFILPVKNINKIFVGGNGWIVVIECDNFKLLSVRPVKANPGVFEQYFLRDKEDILNNAEKTLMRLNEIKNCSNSEELMLSLYQDFRWKQFVMRTKLKSFVELFFSSPSELKLYVIKMMARENVYSQHGIGLLQTNSTRSIIYLGDSNTHGVVMAEVWSENGKLLQSIKVSSESYALSEKIITHALSSYKYTLNELPSEEETKKMILTKTQLYEKYEKMKDEHSDSAN